MRYWSALNYETILVISKDQMDFELLKRVLENEPGYRYKQAVRAIFLELADDWSQVSVLPKELKSKLNSEFPLVINHTLYELSDGTTVKALIHLSDGNNIEAVLMRHKDRNTVCVSSQAGCSMACSFCATGRLGYRRNLTKFEIVMQVLLFARYLKPHQQGVTNVVVMGMGEPMLNYDNVIQALRIVNSKDIFGIGARKISVSTCGIIPGIRRLSDEEMDINLAISLHAPEGSLRSKLMPVNNRFPLDDLMSEVKKYISKKRRRVMFEYLLISGVNDSKDCSMQLVKLLKGVLGFVNLIPYNYTGEYSVSDKQTVQEFRKTLEDNGIEVTQRFAHGRDISAACGQLAAQRVVSKKV